MEPPYVSIIVVYPVDFICDLVLKENIPKMLSVVREYIEEDELYLAFRIKQQMLDGIQKNLNMAIWRMNIR